MNLEAEEQFIQHLQHQVEIQMEQKSGRLFLVEHHHKQHWF